MLEPLFQSQNNFFQHLTRFEKQTQQVIRFHLAICVIVQPPDHNLRRHRRVLALDQGQSASILVMIVIGALMFQRHVAQIPARTKEHPF